MELRKISEAEFSAFVNDQPVVSFLQSEHIAARRANDGWQSIVLGLFDGTSLLGATRVYSKALAFGFKKFEILQGPVIDFSRESAVVEFLKQLKDYVRSNHGVQLEVTPNLLRIHRDNDGKEISGSYDSSSFEAEFQTAGYAKLPYSVSDNRADIFRWVFAKDMTGIDSIEALEKTFSSSTKRSVKRAEKSGIVIREIPKEQVTIFHDIIEKTGERWDFTARSIDYYVALLDSFGAENSRVFVAEISPENYRVYVQDLIDKQQKIIDETSDDGVKEKASTDKAHYQEVIDAVKDATEPIILAGTVVLRYGNEVTHLFSGSYKEHSFLRATSLLRAHALRYALESGVTRFNFYGTKGNHTGHPKEEGIFQFKRGFGGNVEEQLGVFVYTPRPLVNVALKIAARIKRVLR